MAVNHGQLQKMYKIKIQAMEVCILEKLKIKPKEME